MGDRRVRLPLTLLGGALPFDLADMARIGHKWSHPDPAEDTRMELTWVKQQGASNETVLALCRPKSETVWALGRDLHQFETRTAVLHSQEAALDCAFAVNGGLDSIATLADGSVLAAGEELSVLFDGDRWRTIRSGLEGSRRIWGAHAACANALTE